MEINGTDNEIGNTLNNAMYQTIADAIDFFRDIQPELQSVSQQFYQGPSENAWTSLEMFLENMEWLIDLLSIISENKVWIDQKVVIVSLIQELNSILIQLNQALINNDCVLIADLIGYEFIPLFEKMSQCFVSLLEFGEKQ